MSTEVLSAPAAVIHTTKPAQNWLISPWFDLLFVANVAWPVFFLLAFALNTLTHEPLSFMQVYFLSTPHRWITLVLVFFDPLNFPSAPKKYTILGIALLSLGVFLISIGHFYPLEERTLYPLVFLDTIWNIWHFAAQHTGISRIYARLGQRKQTDNEIAFERSAIRCLVIWTYIRTILYLASQPDCALAGYADKFIYLSVGDVLFVSQALVLLVREFKAAGNANRGRLFYLASVITLYGIQLLAMSIGNEPMIKAALLMRASFHAIEYLAIVSWSVTKKSGGVWSYLAPRTALFVLFFIASVGISNYLLAIQSLYAWMVVNLLVSLLHYGYDGMIWKARPKLSGAPVPQGAPS